MNNYKFCKWSIVGLLLLNIALVIADDPVLQPSYNHLFEIRNVEGWTVYINKQDLKEHREEMDKALEHMRFQFYHMTRSIPIAALIEMQERVPVWVEYNTIGIAYHGRKWLIDNGYRPPDLKTMVGYCRMKDFIDVAQDQPCVVLHEQAHGYDHRYLRQDSVYFAGMRSVYEQARNSGRFDSVLCRKKGYKKHYGMNNSAEYFSENSEAYFGANDFFPFVRAELKDYDPDMYDVVERAWGIDRKAEQQCLASYIQNFNKSFGISKVVPVGKESKYESTANYRTSICQGWKVYIHPDLAKNKPYVDRLLKLLAHRLHLIKIYLPENAVTRLQETPIWIEKSNPLNNNVGFYDSSSEFAEKAFNPDKVGAVEIGNSDNFLYWDKLQPWIILNQLSRAFYNSKIKKDSNFFLKTWQQVKQNEKYKTVLRCDGNRVQHPGLISREDFFAEMSESCFGINDHYPFLRFELNEYDSQTYQAILKIYGSIKSM